MRFPTLSSQSHEHDNDRSSSSSTSPSLVDHFLDTSPLKGLPERVVVDGNPMPCGPNLTARRAAIAYCLAHGLSPHLFPRDYIKMDKKRAVVVANLYDSMKNMPLDPDTQASYEALVRETLAQWQYMKATGLKVEYNPTSDGHPDPYFNPRRLMTDVRDNNHLFVTETRLAYGNTSLELDIANPLLREIPSECISGRTPLANDILRVVHDYFGHVREGLGFRAQGEFNAWRGHLAMYSPLAARALTTEVLGQNCWVNFGPFGEVNRIANLGETRYAEQKIGLLPEWVTRWIVEEKCPSDPNLQDFRGLWSCPVEKQASNV
jgi:hypothetical protein